MLRTLYEPSFEHDGCGVGFVVRVDGKPIHETITKGLEILERLEHRGAFGSDPETGDGAGILIQIPDALFRSERPELPEPGNYGVGVVFLPRDSELAARVEEAVADCVRREGQRLLFWRTPRVSPHHIGRQAEATRPEIRQFFVGRGPETAPENFERKLYVIRRLAEKAADALLGPGSPVAFPSLSSRTIVYKGLLLPAQVAAFYQDLKNPLCASAIALVHQRFSTNTAPAWPLAHPYRFLAHNGEINTIQGNRAWLKAREMNLSSPVYGEDIKKLAPIVNPTGSDSASLDQAVELLVHSGLSLPEALMVLVPEAWEKHEEMPQPLKDFYAYSGCTMEAWDGPASLCFSDGRVVGGILDRNGLRPARYTVTTDGWIYYSSETGVSHITTDKILHLGRLRPGEIFLVDTKEGRIVPSDELKDAIASKLPYGEWLAAGLIDFEEITAPPLSAEELPHLSLDQTQRLFGWTREDVEMILRPMAEKGEEASGSMGNDTPAPPFSHKPLMLFDFFRQLFAQVTNPAIDPIRESVVMSLTDVIGSEGSLLIRGPENARQIRIPCPILTLEQMHKVRCLSALGFGISSTSLDCTFDISEPDGALERTLEKLCQKASEAIEAGFNALILSDFLADTERVPVPSLLAVSAIHHHLIRQGTRAKTCLMVETGEAREVHHIATLLGYGASAVCPYASLRTLAQFGPEAEGKYVKALSKGLLKVMSKMGISSVRSYRGAQLFEAVGLSSEVVERWFTGTPSRIEGLKLCDIERECRARHSIAFHPDRNETLEVGGIYQWRRHGERHAWDPEAILALQKAARKNSWTTYKEFSEWVNRSGEEAKEIRGLLDILPTRPALDLDEVEPAKEIVKRFSTGAMSLGSLSRPSHEGLAEAMNAIGGRSNSGEGGEDPERFETNLRSAIKQIASGRFGVTTSYLVHADELQIKVAQGAKPGEGGQLPGAKVDPYIAKIRHTNPGVTLISPPPHHDIYSIEDLAQLIRDLRSVNPSARVSVKLVSEAGVGTVAAGVVKADADTIVISGGEGGTGAAPLTSIRHAGLPWELGIAEAQQTLLLNGLRGRVRLQVDGQMKTGRDVVVGALLGADEFGFATAPLVVQGCLMMRVCHLGTCPVGIATQDPELVKKFTGKPEHLINYFFFVAEEVRLWMAKLGFRTFDEMVGRVECLKPSSQHRHWKARGLDFSRLLAQVQPHRHDDFSAQPQKKSFLPADLEGSFLNEVRRALSDGRPLLLEAKITNVDRTFGALISGEIVRRGGAAPGSVRMHLKGSAGQSFGAFLVEGVELTLVGDANDYLGKGLSGGQIVVKLPPEADLDPSNSVIAGNTLLYGATSGRAFLGGTVGERFAVRNSGATAVVEGVGDHACEYMTGGTIVILGDFGRNFGAGMSGGKALVYDPSDRLGIRLNEEAGLCISELGEEETFFKDLISLHHRHTGSPRAAELLKNWESAKSCLKLVSPPSSGADSSSRALEAVGGRA